ncbi:MAG: spermine synthase [Methylobacter sp.]|nr:spermine synthase [Methylobacter sp.]MDP2427095.1 spermine synthase [Methylobacter sp.]MDP3055871.1 spermine synthase [Methylobacter sp.]MDP3363453.1 spermine synthase [Methylobacter sp.]MDZ4217944.1 spermine synthase [Methylobacter sp.]
MYRYQGRIIHESHDDDGILEVIEQDGVRSLHFGSFPKQSSMLLAEPDKLHLEYVRAMTSWLLFKPTLDGQALIIGLGGGSLTKHLLHHFPDCRLKVVEYRESVVKIARSHFGLPLDPRLKVIIDDGAKYVRQRTESQSEQYSLMFVDAFDHEGMAPSICNHAFFDACKALLKKDGMLVINLWGGVNKPQFQQVALWLGQTFDWKILFLPVKDRGNIIGLAFNDQTPPHDMKDLRTRAIILEQLYQIEFISYLKEIIKHNSSVINNSIKK